MDERALEIIGEAVHKETLRNVIEAAYGGEIPSYVEDFDHNTLFIKMDGIFGEETAVISIEEAFNFGNPNFSTMLCLGGVTMDHRPAMNLAEECCMVFSYMIEHYLSDIAANSQEFQEHIKNKPKHTLI